MLTRTLVNSAVQSSQIIVHMMHLSDQLVHNALTALRMHSNIGTDGYTHKLGTTCPEHTTKTILEFLYTQLLYYTTAASAVRRCRRGCHRPCTIPSSDACR